MLIRSLICLLLVSGAFLAQAGKDGYLRQGPPLRLRVAEPLPPRPAVNERILALGKPVEVPAEEDVAVRTDEAASVDEPVEVVAQPDKPAAAANVIVVDTAPSGDASRTAGELLAPGLEVVSPKSSDAEEARRIAEILSLFNASQPSRGANRSTVIVAPPTFLPPQPVVSGPPSRAVYRSP